MKHKSLPLALAFATPLFAASTIAQAAPQKLGDFGLIDHQGAFHQLSRYAHKSAVVLITQAIGCEEIATRLPSYKALRQKWEPQNVAFLMINSSAQASREDVRREAEIYDLDFPILLDPTQLVSETLGLNTSGEILVLDPISMRVTYRGPLDRRTLRGRGRGNQEPPALAGALSRAVAGEADSADPIVVAMPEVEHTDACAAAYPNPEAIARVDYAKEVAPVLAANCVTCHQDGGIGPFAMDSYRQVRGWSAMMRETVMTKRMPPAQVDPAIGHFTNARYLADEDLKTLVHWIDQGAPRSGAEDPLVVAEVPAKEADWELGEPDFIVRMAEKQHVPATGVLDYRNVNIDLPFEEDKWIKAVQFRPGDKKVLHHLLSYVIPPEYDQANDGTVRTQRRFLEGYAPGKTEAQVFPEGAGVYIPKGFRVRFSLHYTTYGKETYDDTILGLYFYDTPPPYEFHNKSVTQASFAIPPGAIEHKASQQFVFDKDIVLWGMRPHMHYRGKHFKFKVIYPDNTVEELLSVPNYNFAWQPTYRMSNPKTLPAGSRVVITGAFDNSEYNLDNPDPTKEIRWGNQSWDEMFIGYFAYHNLAKDNPESKER